MEKPLEEKLVADRTRLLREAAERITNEGQADLAADLLRLELYDRLLAPAPTPPWRRLVAPTLVGLICLAIVGVAWSFHLPVTRLTVVADTESASLQLAEPWNWPAALPLKTESIRLTDFSAIRLPSTNGTIVRLTGSPWAQIAGGQALLSRLTLGNEGVLLLARGDDGRINLFGRGAMFSGELAIWGKPTLSAGQEIKSTAFSGPVDLVDADTVTFSAKGEGAVPAYLQLLPKEPALLTNLRISKLSFARDVPDRPGGTIFTSAVLGGKLKLDDLGTEITLSYGDRLTLADANGIVREIRFGDRMTVTFTGYASRVLVGAQDRTPTLIEYAYYSQRFAFFWAAAVSIGGMLWSARRYLSSSLSG